MAVTKLLRLKEAKGNNKAAHLRHNIFYICNPDKCDGGLWIGGNAGTTPDIIYQTMIGNKQFWGKEDGSQGFHYVISFPPDLSVTEEQAYQIAEDFCRELLNGRFYFVFAVHNDQHHMHVHITFDSVSKEDGFKFHSPKGDWEKRIQPITDRICKKYGLPELTFTDEKRGTSYDQWKHDKEKEIDSERQRSCTWYDLIRDDIDVAIAESESYEEVLGYLRNKKYEIREGKYLSLRPYGKERAVRSSRLGRGYSIDEIKSRILAKKVFDPEKESLLYGDREEMFAVIRLKVRRSPGWKMTPFQRQYYHRWNNTFLRNKPGRYEPWKYNKDVVRVRRLSDAVKYMIDHDIRSLDDLEEKWEAAKRSQEAMESERNALRTRLQRSTPYRELAQYEKLKKAYEENPSPETLRKMDSLILKIEERMSFSEAAAERDKLRKKADAYKKELKQIRAECRLMDDLFTFYFDMPVPKTEKQGSEPKQSSQKDQRTERIHRSERGERTRITVHRSLILRRPEEDPGFYTVRIPGWEEYLRIPAGDCLLYKSGEILSAYLYDNAEYLVVDENGNEIRTMTGEQTKAFYEEKLQRSRRKER